MVAGRTLNHRRMHGSSAVLVEVAILGILCVLFFWRILTAESDKIIAGFDILHIFYCAQEFTKESLLQGRIPKWNPYESCGMPFAADPSNVVFYPFNKLFLWIPIPKAIGLTVVFHVFLAGVGTLLFARAIGIQRGGAILAAIAFMFSSYFIDRIAIGHLCKIMSTSYLPWLLWCYEMAFQRRNVKWCLLGGMLLALQVLAGTGQIFVYTGLFLLVYGILKSFTGSEGLRRELLRAGGYLLVIGVIGVAVSAVQLIPTAELALQSLRSEPSLRFALLYSFPPSNFLNFLLPHLNIGKAFSNWETSGYLGIFPLGLALATVLHEHGKRVLPIIGVIIVALAIMLAQHNPAFPLMAAIIFPLKLFRIPGRAIFGLTFGLAILAGIGWDRLFGVDPTNSKGLKVKLVAVFAAFLAVAAVVVTLFLLGKLSIHYQLPVPGKHFGTLVDDGENIESIFHRRALFPLCLIIASLLISFALQRRSHHYLSVMVLALVVVDLVVTNGGRIRLISADYMDKTDAPIERLKPEEESQYFRVWLQEDIFASTRAKHFKIFGVSGLSPLGLRTLDEYIAGLTGIQQVRDQRAYLMNPMIFTQTTFLRDNILNVKYFDYRPLPPRRQVILVMDSFFPRVCFVTDYLRGTPEEFLAAKIDPQQTVYLHDDPPKWPNNSLKMPERPRKGTAKVAIESYSNDEILLSADVPENGFVVLSEVYYPGWRAEIDGGPCKVLRGNYLLRVIPITEGKHELRVFFAPRSLAVGAAITGFSVVVTMLALLGAWIFERRPISMSRPDSPKEDI